MPPQQQTEKPTGGQPPTAFLTKVAAGKNLEARQRTFMHGWLDQVYAANRLSTQNPEVTAFINAERPLIDSYCEAIIEGSTTGSQAAGAGALPA